MKPTDQTKIGKDNGNCFMACAASILGLDLEEVVDLTPCYSRPGSDNWADAFEAWLNSVGWTSLCVTPSKNLTCSAFAIASGLSPRGDFLHSVVWKEGEVVHDPHSSRDGLAGPIKDLIFLMPIDPSMSDIEETAIAYIKMRRMKLEAKEGRRVCMVECRQENDVACFWKEEREEWCEHCVKSNAYHRQFLSLSAKAGALLRRLERQVNRRTP